MTVFSSDFNIVKASIIATVFGIGGWLGAQGFMDLFDIRQLPPLIKIGISIAIFWGGFKLGLRKK